MNNTLSDGETLFADGKIEEAEKCFLSLVESDSKCKEAYNNLGVIAFQANDNERAIDYFTRALEIDFLYTDAIINYTNLLKFLNQLSIAIPLLEKVLKNNPEDSDIKQLLNDCHDLQATKSS